MNAKLPFDPNDYPPDVVRLIMAKAESANCSPSEALRLLLNEMAAQAGFTAGPASPRRKRGGMYPRRAASEREDRIAETFAEGLAGNHRKG